MASPCNAQPINLGNPAELTINGLAEMIRSMTGSASAVVRCELPSDDPRQRQPDIRKARTLLGWEPKVSIEEGLRQTIEDFRQRVFPPTLK